MKMFSNTVATPAQVFIQMHFIDICDNTHSRRYTLLSHIQNVKYLTFDAFRIVTPVEEV